MTDALPTPEAELDVVTRLLVDNPRNLAALLRKGRALERLGREAEAVGAYDGALAVAPPFWQLTPGLQAEVRHAHESAQSWHERRDAFLRERLADQLGKRETRRFEQSLDVLGGRRTVYRQQPHQFFFPELPCIEFYDPDDFPWLQAIVDATPAIRDEFLAVHAVDSGFEPYIAYPDGAPLDQWTELNRNPRWSAFHLLRDGKPVQPNADRCPRTMAALQGAPQPMLQGRTPTAMFSLLKPRTRIPPHTGVTNARLVVHIPLIVPDKCLYRVGGQSRPWRVGEPLIFDDSIEHEAWNDSDESRTVLIFDIWNPFIAEAERALVASLYEALDAFGGTAAGWS